MKTAPASDPITRGAASDRDLSAWEPASVELHEVVRSLGRGAGKRLVLDGLSDAIAAGRMTAVIGRSGAGKTTLLRIVAGLDVPDSGEVVLDGVPLHDRSAEDLAWLRRQRIGYLPQEPLPVPFLSAVENVTLVLALRGWQADAARRRATIVLARVGLGDRSGQRVARLSAGERQRVALARALASARGLLIVDEPTSRLDRVNAAMVAELLVAAAASDRQTVICATHDADVIRCADEVIAL